MPEVNLRFTQTLCESSFDYVKCLTEVCCHILRTRKISMYHYFTGLRLTSGSADRHPANSSRIVKCLRRIDSSLGVLGMDPYRRFKYISHLCKL